MRGLVCVLVCLTLLPFALPGSSAFSHPDPGDHPYHEGWSAPLDFSGDITIGFTVDFGTDNHCTFHVGMASVDPSGDVYMHSTGPVGATAWGGRLVQAHHDDLDTRELMTSGGGGVGLRMWASGTFDGSHDVRMTVFGASALTFDPDDPWDPVAYEIGCDAPFTVSGLYGGHEAHGFTHQSLDGTGASANGLFARASANLGGSTGATFESPDFHFDFFDFGSQLGTLALEDETGTVAQWDLPSTFQGAYDGGPGAYTATIDRVAAGSFESFVGVMAGTGPVDSFDELV